MKKIAYTGLALALPFLAFAQPRVNSVQDAGGFIVALINQVAVPVIFALAFIVFIFGIFQYFVAGGHNDEKRESGKKLMLYGLIGLFVMVSVWGLVQILVGSVGLQNTPPKLPNSAPAGSVNY